MDEQIVYGLHSVTTALRSDVSSIAGLWVDAKRHDPRVRKLVDNAKSLGVEVHRCDRKELDNGCGNTHHQGVMLKRSGEESKPVADLHDLVEKAANPLILVLDSVQDPHNLGACLRSADAAGVTAVVVPADRAVGLTASARKVACGAADTVPLVTVTNLARSLEELKRQGVWLVGATGDTDSAIYDIDLKGPIAIVMGAEGKGLRRLTKEACDMLASIPMVGTVESLNVSVAAGVLMFEAVRQRRGN